ncbi:MAG: heat-inducible transcriptional repressor HrcA [Defluviitaleaceae bacterium]|nr:heat-inducible transcriptional repressor HrcA [Defluviitaleaceae bacterium]
MDVRKVRILECIINDYIATAEPVGSRTIAKKCDLGLSSATIRNEMSDLEEMGYIVAPHASAGRVPSDAGYRFFVDRLLHQRIGGSTKSDKSAPALSPEALAFLEAAVFNNINQIDYLLKETAKAISFLTNYIAVVSEAVTPIKGERIKSLVLIPVDENTVLLTTVTSAKNIKNHSLRLAAAPDVDACLTLSRVMNIEFAGKELGAITPAAKKRLITAFAAYPHLLQMIVTVLEGVVAEGGKPRIYTGGIKNILTLPEFDDKGKALALFEAIEEQDYLMDLLNEADSGKVPGINVVIGAENQLVELKNCSIVKTTYHTGGGRATGDIAIIGPTRMDYSQAVNILQGIADKINNALKNINDST